MDTHAPGHSSTKEAKGLEPAYSNLVADSRMRPADSIEDEKVDQRNRSRAAGRRRTMSVAGRARVAAAQRARWAKVKGRNVVSITSRRRRKLSAAALARIRAAQRARWAKWRKQQKHNDSTSCPWIDSGLVGVGTHRGVTAAARSAGCLGDTTASFGAK